MKVPHGHPEPCVQKPVLSTSPHFGLRNFKRLEEEKDEMKGSMSQGAFPEKKDLVKRTP